MNNKVTIISIGDEILIGQINNTNATWMAEKLNEFGFHTVGIQSISDQAEAIQEGLRYAATQSNLVLVTGGLGPTKDDITKQCVADYFGSQLVMNEQILQEVTNFFAQRGKTLTELNRRQALIPDNCTAISNPEGTAPGMYFLKDQVHYIFMPGVPFEMKAIMNSWVLPKMSEILNVDTIVQKTVLTHGIGESFLADIIEQWENNLPQHIKLAYLPSPGRVRLRLRAIGNNKNELSADIVQEIFKLSEIIPQYIFGFDNEKMEEIVGKLLTDQNKTLALAESCTGGYIGHKITEVPGCSKYFKGALISYSNDVKINNLNVKPEDLEKHGAVSEQVVKQMAEGARKVFSSDYAIATSGIAGPDGGTDDKPVGTVWIALSGPHETIAKKFLFGNHRLRNINMTTFSALNLLRVYLIEQVKLKEKALT